MEQNEIKIGTKVKVVDVANFKDKKGTITGFNLNNALPIFITIDGDTYETDFRLSELEVL
jgi:hypothetical protein